MSSKRRGGLGRGLGALIPTAPPEMPGDPPAEQPAGEVGAGEPPPSEQRGPGTPDTVPTEVGPSAADAVDGDRADAASDAAELAPVPGAMFVQVAVSDVVPNAKQPRQVFDEDALAELAHSIREFGVLQPIVVRAIETADQAQPHDSGVNGAAHYELVMGERRWRAASVAGLDTVPAIVRSTADDAMLRDALLENIHRAQLNPLEEAAAYQQLLDEFGTTHDELAQRIGRSRPQVSNTIRLLQLPLAVQRRVAAGVLSAGHARALLGLENGDQQDELAARIVAEGLSVRATEELVSLGQRGGLPSKASRTRSPRITAPAVAELAADLSDAFDTRVRVDLGRRKGRITVEFASIDDLERIVGVMAPQIAATRRGEPGDGAAATQDGDSGAEDSAGEMVANEP